MVKTGIVKPGTVETWPCGLEAVEADVIEGFSSGQSGANL
jgi:hypothetical protein